MADTSNSNVCMRMFLQAFVCCVHQIISVATSKPVGFAAINARELIMNNTHTYTTHVNIKFVNPLHPNADIESHTDGYDMDDIL